MSDSGTRSRAGVTLVEFLAVVAIIGVLIALLLPAVNAAREAARSTSCRNKLRNIGVAMLAYESVHRQFPSGGWGFGWVGDPDSGGVEQPGSWCYSILPFLEEEALYAVGKGLSEEERRHAAVMVLATPVDVYYCPSRRDIRIYPFKSHSPANAKDLSAAIKSDYAANGGDVGLGGGWGPRSFRDARTFRWDDFSQANGICHQRSRVRIRDIRDGTSRTYMVGEKHVNPTAYITGLDPGDDQSAYTGYDSDTVRWTPLHLPPARDAEGGSRDQFGAAHAAGCNFVMCDGSVSMVAYDVDPEIHRSRGNRRDGT